MSPEPCSKGQLLTIPVGGGGLLPSLILCQNLLSFAVIDIMATEAALGGEGVFGLRVPVLSQSIKGIQVRNSSRN